MHTIEEEIIPKENAWFSPNVRYEGWGRAEFADDRGAAEGHVTALFGEDGTRSILMKVEKAGPTTDAVSGLFELSAPVLLRDQHIAQHNFGTKNNPCTELSVRTQEGVFRGVGEIDYGISTSDEEACINFHSSRYVFDPDAADEPKYWVAPLMNFVCQFSSSAQIANHPLRLFVAPDVPSGRSRQDYLWALIAANSRNKIITFTFNGFPGFIEPLADYKVRGIRLKDKLSRALITAVMVGEIGHNSIEQKAVRQWFPFGLMRALGLATGSEPSVPWIEFRDAKGKLCRRVHDDYGSTDFTEGRRIIYEGSHSPTGHFMTCYLASEHFGKGYMNVAMKHAAKTWVDGATIEEMLIYAVRGLDSLCGHFGLRQQDLGQRLQQQNKQDVRKVLGDAAAKIARLVSNSSAFLSEAEKRALIKISQRTESTPWGATRDFGLALTDLLDKFAFPDAAILDAHYASKTAGTGKASTWTSMLSHIRGAPIHSGFFDFDGGEFVTDDIVAVTVHLHDLLARIILKMVGYNGEYQPRVVPAPATRPVDWVKPTTSAKDLGYS